MTTTDLLSLPHWARGRSLVVSRASWIRRARLGPDATILPVVGGRTVWAAVEGTDSVYLIEQPNYFGRFEHHIPANVEAVTIRRWPGAPGVGSVINIATDVRAEHLDTARKLAGRLSQIPRLKIPHGKPETPWLVASLPIDPSRVAAELSKNGFVRCDPVHRNYPEFPGGLRIEVAWPKERNEQFVRAVESAIGF